MEPALFGRLETDPSLPVFTPERSNGALAHCALRCRCGGDVFRLTGWPYIVSGRGGFFWRTLTRVWREARLPMQDGEPVDSPFWLPIMARCDRCGRDETLFDHPCIGDRMPVIERSEPLESVRCRACRRGRFELVAGVAMDETSDTPVAVELVARCHSCQRQARLAWSDTRPSDQELRLDLLYGRR